jgi:argonaute-like protein implicated in RNA metabolism and viral defense
MYYKSGGVPWRLTRDASDYATCYAGVSFYRSLDEKRVQTSIAQIFNARGEGIVVRGAQAQISKEDRTPHLSENDSAAILVQTLQRYREEHGNLPARVVLHKSSYFTPEEIAGFRTALEQERVSMGDMLSIRSSAVRLFRLGQYPVLRGTHMALDESRHLLYTRGSVPFFETYPGLYVPRALEVVWDDVEQSREALCREILALTKMNWNSTEFDMRDPITLRAAKRVGDILKYVPPDAPADKIARRYSFYM